MSKTSITSDERCISLISKLSRRLGEAVNPDDVLNMMTNTAQQLTGSELFMFLINRQRNIDMYISRSNAVNEWEIEQIRKAGMKRFMMFAPDMNGQDVPINIIERQLYVSGTQDPPKKLFHMFIPAMLQGEVVGLYGVGTSSEISVTSDIMDYLSIMVNMCVPYYFIG